eukprot:gnl/MRDRNA2_/MRDRNA2_128399_c0_seq1.p1 gnl/MRDRNA2_/MRDRNA2_128399_c0~~gnl/MRDRNA2_/MRDRNA2_128399_c0_seq1.p1  ORF type:complete len:347 (-),score=57.03 gnl/MRDRNA2_/MRDRNA2_128399_c0_seq1:129-1169(-)
MAPRRRSRGPSAEVAKSLGVQADGTGAPSQGIAQRQAEDAPYQGFFSSDLRTRLGEVLGQGPWAGQARRLFCCSCESLPTFVSCDAGCANNCVRGSTSSRHNVMAKESVDEIRGSSVVPVFCPLDKLDFSRVPEVVTLEHRKDLNGPNQSSLRHSPQDLQEFQEMQEVEEDIVGFNGGLKRWPPAIEAEGLHVGPPYSDFVAEDIVPVGFAIPAPDNASTNPKEMDSPEVSLPHAAQAMQPQSPRRHLSQRHPVSHSDRHAAAHLVHFQVPQSGQLLPQADVQASVGAGYLRLRRLKRQSHSYSPRVRNADELSTRSPDAGSTGAPISTGSQCSEGGLEAMGLLSL